MKAVNWELYMLILMEVVLILRDCGDKSTYQSFKRFRLTFFFFFKFLAVLGLCCSLWAVVCGLLTAVKLLLLQSTGFSS